MGIIIKIKAYGWRKANNVSLNKELSDDENRKYQSEIGTLLSNKRYYLFLGILATIIALPAALIISAFGKEIVPNWLIALCVFVIAATSSYFFGFKIIS